MSIHNYTFLRIIIISYGQLASNKSVTELSQNLSSNCCKEHVAQLFCRRVVLIPFNVSMYLHEQMHSYLLIVHTGGKGARAMQKVYSPTLYPVGQLYNY